MPKNKRKLIGYVRPRKRAMSEEEEALEEPPITNGRGPDRGVDQKLSIFE